MPTWTYGRDSRWELASQRGAYPSRIRCCGLTLAVSRRHAPCFTGVRFVQLHWSGMGSLQLQIEHLDEDRKRHRKVSSPLECRSNPSAINVTPMRSKKLKASILTVGGARQSD